MIEQTDNKVAFVEEVVKTFGQRKVQDKVVLSCLVVEARFLQATVTSSQPLLRS